MARSKPPPKWLEAARHSGEAGGVWLSRALARAGVMPTKDAEAAIRAGRVSVDGVVAREPLAPVRRGAKVTLDGHGVALDFHTRILLFHKPAGLVTHGSDPEGIGTVFDGLGRVLPEGLRGYGWHAVGRLDRDTTGLLLFTNDEKFVAHATLPETHLPKRYVATVGAEVTEAALEALRAGPTLDDGPTRANTARSRGPKVVELTLTEGRYHQVKRMLQAVGLPTLALHREAVGDVVCDVELGQVRELTAEEIQRGLRYTPR